MKTLSRETIESFSAMTNAEVYVEAFHKRLMGPYPAARRAGEYLGNSHRADFYPFLRHVLNSYSSRERLRLLDVGAGSGETIGDVIKDFPVEISLIEPNSLLLKDCLSTIAEHDNLELGKLYKGTVQNLYNTARGLRWSNELDRQDVIMAVHMIYYLTNFNNKDIDPMGDIIRFVSEMYRKLDDGGTLFIVYADQPASILGQAALFYFEHQSPYRRANLREIYLSRRFLLEGREIVNVLNRDFPSYRCEAKVTRTNSRIFGNTKDDITVLCLLGEMGSSDEQPFRIDKLLLCSEFVDTYGDLYNLHRETRTSRKGMWTARAPQVICQFKKAAR